MRLASRTLPTVALTSLKKDLTSATLRVIDENLLFVIETGALKNVISASLIQENQPVAFFSQMLNENKISHSSVENEASTIMEAVRKWAQFLSDGILRSSQTNNLYSPCTAQETTAKSRTTRY